jgi:PPOX class probable F420-dependent enzyme
MGEDVGTPLDGERYINLETFKRDGTGIKTPVWVAPLDGRLVIFTSGSSYKVKRVRRNPSCRAAACDARGNLKGPWHDGQCRILDEEGGRRAHQALRKKYGWQMRVADFFAGISGRTAKRAYLEVTLQERAPPT